MTLIEHLVVRNERLQKETIKKLLRQAEEEGIAPGELIRRIVEEFFEEGE